MTALVDNGQNWMQPLLDFRNRLVENRNLTENRSETRRNGQEAIREDGSFNGNYNAHYRFQILKDLLLVQKEVQKERPHITLINNQELIAIQVTWNRDGIFDFSVGELYKEIFNKDISTNNIKTLDDTERRILRDVCKEEPDYYHLIDNLIALQETKTLMISKYGLHNDVEKRIENFVNESFKTLESIREITKLFSLQMLQKTLAS
jgi:DNA sulfur modification protein DndC